MKEYAGLVYGVARRAGLDSSDAEDCAQFAWLALYRNRQKIRSADAVPAWLVRTVKRRSLRVSTRLRREMPLETVELPIQTDEQREGEFADAELKSALHEALEQLDPRCRDLLVHLFSDDRPASYRDLAERTGVAANTIGPLRSRCLGRLKKILNKMGWRLH